MSNRTIVYKQCRYHKRLDGAQAEKVCEDCRKLTFRATMAARGVKVVTPGYSGGYPRSYVDAGDGWPDSTRNGQPSFSLVDKD